MSLRKEGGPTLAWLGGELLCPRGRRVVRRLHGLAESSYVLAEGGWSDACMALAETWSPSYIYQEKLGTPLSLFYTKARIRDRVNTTCKALQRARHSDFSPHSNI